MKHVNLTVWQSYPRNRADSSQRVDLVVECTPTQLHQPHSTYFNYVIFRGAVDTKISEYPTKIYRHSLEILKEE